MLPSGYEQLRVFEEALACLPKDVETVRLRSDTAGYQHELLKYCEMGTNKRFGRIEVAIGCDVGKSFKEAAAQLPETDWHPLYRTVGTKQMETGTYWAEVCFVPNKIGHSKNGLEYRYLAKRQVLTEQLTLSGMEDPKLSLPFPTMEMNDSRYKIFGIVTNISETKMNGEELIHFLHARCGKSEEVHSVMKSDLSGGTLPSGDFGKNAAWWWIMILSLNLNLMIKKLALEPSMAIKG